VELLQGVGVKVGNALGSDASSEAVFSSLSEEAFDLLAAGPVYASEVAWGGDELLGFVPDEEDVGSDGELPFPVEEHAVGEVDDHLLQGRGLADGEADEPGLTLQ